MPKVVGGLMALLALGASMIAQVDPVTCLQRAMVALIIGGFLTQLWYVFFTVRVQTAESEIPKQEIDATVEQAA